ncbi:MAG: glycosyltransferase [Calditrichaeota bacterium]|nr:MAG: glycosyltransferase [Calditrichota bacterium]
MPSAEILCVSWHSTLPLNTGANIRIRSILQEYKKVKPVLLAPAPADDTFEHLEFEKFQFPKWLNKFVPFHTEIFCCLGSKPFKSALKLLANRKFVAVQCEHLWTYPLAKKLAQHFKIPLLLVEHNIETTYVERAYGKKIFTSVVRRLEKKALDGSDRIVVCSEIDAKILQDKFNIPSGKIWIVPNGVYIEEKIKSYGRDLLPELLQSRDFVVFLGKTSYQPNREAIEIIEKELIGRLASKGVTVAVVGGPAEPDYSQLDNGLVFTGFVPEIEPFVMNATACIAPLISGSGTRLKILEYAGLGRPIVATSVAAEGIDLKNNQEILLRDDWNSFCAAIIEIRNENSRWNKLGEKAKAIVQQKYKWQSISASFEHQFMQLSK